ILEGNRAKTEEDRRVAEENIEALREAGVFEVMVPRRFGGYEMTLREKLEVSAAVGESCGSTAWVVALANGGAWLASLLPAGGQEEIFGAPPNPHLAGVLNQTKEVTKVDGGYVLSGKWPFASGSLHANWGLVGFEAVGKDGQVDPALAFYPMD